MDNKNAHSLSGDMLKVLNAWGLREDDADVGQRPIWDG